MGVSVHRVGEATLGGKRAPHLMAALRRASTTLEYGKLVERRGDREGSDAARGTHIHKSPGPDSST